MLFPDVGFFLNSIQAVNYRFRLFLHNSATDLLKYVCTLKFRFPKKTHLQPTGALVILVVFKDANYSVFLKKTKRFYFMCL